MSGEIEKRTLMTKKSRYIIDQKRLAVRCRAMGLPADGDLVWWMDDKDCIQWQVRDGRKLHPDLARLDMSLRWRGRLDRHGNTTLQPPAAVFARLDAEALLSRLQNVDMLTLGWIGAKRFYLDARDGLMPLRKRGQNGKDRRQCDK
jgi:hypothetical protein